MEHFNSLIEDGFEVKSVRFYGHPQSMNTAVLLVRGEERLEARANAIDDYLLHLRELYDFDKQKTSFVYITDTELYHQFEEELFTLLPNISIGPKSKAILSKKLDTPSWGKIIGLIQDRIQMEKGRKYGIKKLSEIFFFVCFIGEKAGSVTRMTYSKEAITLNEIEAITENARDYDNCIIFSPFLLSTKIGSQNGDMLVGITVYDLKNNQILAFNIQSLVSFVKAQSVQKDAGLYDVVKYLFDRTLSENMELRSYLPAPIDSPYYTALPWISYSVLSPPKLDEQIGIPADNISIPNFFIFGCPSLPTEERSFVFSNFSIDKEGHAYGEVV
jgi:hypothetical protein